LKEVFYDNGHNHHRHHRFCGAGVCRFHPDTEAWQGRLRVRLQRLRQVRVRGESWEFGVWSWESGVDVSVSESVWLPGYIPAASLTAASTPYSLLPTPYFRYIFSLFSKCLKKNEFFFVK
jgi:hypothetical protein